MFEVVAINCYINLSTMNGDYEKKLGQAGFEVVCGIDEVGRGPMAGPIVAAAVILDLSNVDALQGVNDSKKLTEKKRESLYDIIINSVKDWAVAEVTAAEIDSNGIALANTLVMRKAWQALKIRPDFVATDYMTNLWFEIPFEAIKKGDSKVLSIAAASIIAKVTRDRQMVEYAKQYPEYGFDSHKGYGSKKHLDAIREYGPCPIHRQSFGLMKKRLF